MVASCILILIWLLVSGLCLETRRFFHVSVFAESHSCIIVCFGRPLVKWFALCYRTVICLSVLSVTSMYCGQTVGRIKMKLGMQVGLGHGHVVLKGKGKEEYLYSAFLHQGAKRSGMDHTVLPGNNTVPAFPSCTFTRCHHHSNCGSRHPIAAHYSFIDPERMKGCVGLVG